MFLQSKEEKENFQKLLDLENKIKDDFTKKVTDYNKDNISGVEGFINLQKKEIKKIKEKMKIENKNYMKNHPEIKQLMNIYMIMLLKNRPEDVLTFTGNFFSKNNLKDFIGIKERELYEENN